MDPKDIAILKSIGDWWKVNGESIRGCDRTPLPVQTWGESTRKGDTLYLHVFDWPKDGTLVIGGLKSNVKNVRLLSASRAIPFSVKRLNTLDIAINGLPAEAPDAADSVIAIECEGGVIADNARLLQPSFATETLRVFDAQLHGKSLRFGAGKVRDAHVTGWKKSDEFIFWQVRIDEPAEYEVELVYDAEPESTGATFAVNFGSQSLTGKVRSGKIQTVALGRTTFQPGNLEIKLTTIEKRDAEVMQPRSLILKRVNRELR